MDTIQIAIHHNLMINYNTKIWPYVIVNNKKKKDLDEDGLFFFLTFFLGL